jgi:hypothetical protein
MNIYFWLKENILALIHLRVLLLNKYEISSISEYPRLLIPRWSSGHPPFCNFPCFARDYLQTGYSDMLDISYLFNNNTLKCIKAKIFSFNQKWWGTPAYWSLVPRSSMFYLFELCLKNMWNCSLTQHILSHSFYNWKLCELFRLCMQ